MKKLLGKLQCIKNHEDELTTSLMPIIRSVEEGPTYGREVLANNYNNVKVHVIGHPRYKIRSILILIYRRLTKVMSLKILKHPEANK
jgi:hypothetical protein